MQYINELEETNNLQDNVVVEPTEKIQHHIPYERIFKISINAGDSCTLTVNVYEK